MIGSAFIYALFTGFDVPAARTAWMLLAIGAVRLTLLPISTMRVLLALAIVMAWLDPYVLWQAGYWLSFIAVALLLKYDEALQSQTSSTASSASSLNKLNQKRQSFIKLNAFNNKLWLGFKRIFRLQFWLFIALLPITLLLFGKASLWGLIINLFAIGLFGWIIVPLNLLAGLCYLLSPTIADGIWALVSTIVNQLHQLIDWLTTLPMLKSAWLYTPINIAMLLIAALVILPWLLPRGLLSRLLSIPPLTLLLMTIYSNQQSFSKMPTLYILPTSDHDITATVLTYPIEKNAAKLTKGSQKSVEKNRVNWLFLADHSLSDERSRPSSLTAEKLAAIVEQQLRTLAINNLQGIIVQSSAVSLTDSLSTISATANKNDGSPSVSKISQSSSISKESLDSKAPQSSLTQSLLPLTVAKLSQRVPTKQYWQAGRHERWAEHQKLSAQANNQALISAQDCQQSKQWQDLSGQLTLEVLTGWSEINDASVWDCSLSITSQSPIQIVHYNAADPQQPSLATVQTLTSQKMPSTSEDSAISSRLILDTATHKGGWQLQSLLCSAKPFLVDMKTLRLQSTSWLSHSSSKVSAEALVAQQIDRVLTYDQQPLALTIGANTNKVIYSHK